MCVSISLRLQLSPVNRCIIMTVQIGRKVDAGPAEEEAFPSTATDLRRLKSTNSLSTVLDTGRPSLEEGEEGEENDEDGGE